MLHDVGRRQGGMFFSPRWQKRDQAAARGAKEVKTPSMSHKDMASLKVLHCGIDILTSQS